MHMLIIPRFAYGIIGLPAVTRYEVRHHGKIGTARSQEK